MESSVPVNYEVDFRFFILFRIYFCFLRTIKKLVHAAYTYTSTMRTYEGQDTRDLADQQPNGTTLKQVHGQAPLVMGS